MVEAAEEEEEVVAHLEEEEDVEDVAGQEVVYERALEQREEPRR